MLTYKELIGLSCGETRCCHSIRKQHFFMLQKRHFERRIISKHEDIHWSRGSLFRTTGPNHAGFFPFSYLDDKVWNISRNPHAYSQLIWLRLGPLLQECRRITRLMFQNAFHFNERRMQKMFIWQWTSF